MSGWHARYRHRRRAGAGRGTGQCDHDGADVRCGAGFLRLHRYRHPGYCDTAYHLHVAGIGADPGYQHSGIDRHSNVRLEVQPKSAIAAWPGDLTLAALPGGVI